MRASVGDRVVIASHRVDGPVRDGEIMAVGDDGAPPYRVRWSDNGRVSVYFPGPDAHVQHFREADDHEVTSGAAGGAEPTTESSSQRKTWRIDVTKGSTRPVPRQCCMGRSPMACKASGWRDGGRGSRTSRRSVTSLRSRGPCGDCPTCCSRQPRMTSVMPPGHRSACGPEGSTDGMASPVTSRVASKAEPGPTFDPPPRRARQRPPRRSSVRSPCSRSRPPGSRLDPRS